MAGPFLIFGHRGSPKRFAENTIESFEEALRAGADGFETDLRMLANRSAVLFHDDDFEGTEIESLSFDECSKSGAKIARLSDLARFADRATMVLEVKRGNWVEALIDEVRQWPNIVLASFDHSLIAELHRRNVSFPLGITIYGSMVNVAAYAADIGASWCFPNYHYVSAELVQSLHARGVRVIPWTPNREREWSWLREIGCDGMITDLPAEAVVWRGSSGPP